MNITFLFLNTLCLFNKNVQVSLDHFLDLKKNQQMMFEQNVTLFYNPSFDSFVVNIFVDADHEPAVEIVHQFHQIDNFLGHFCSFPLLSKQYFLMHSVDRGSISFDNLRNAEDDKFNFQNI